MNCTPIKTQTPGIYCCTQCGKQNPRPINKPFYANCGPPKPPPDLTPLLARLAKLTNHPEIIDQPEAYGRAVQIWAAGIPDQCKPFETRDDEEVEFIETICRANVCKKCNDGACRPSCGPEMLVTVKARMASECCPWEGKRW